MSIEIKGDSKNNVIYFGLEKRLLKQRKRLKDALHDAGYSVSEEIRRNINREGRTGNYYTYNGVRYRASAPGQVPANRSGKLREGVDYRVRGHDEAEFGYTTSYGKFLEKGTRKMDPRPNVYKVANKNAVDFVRTITFHLNTTLR